MKEKPILFSTSMIHAILEGRKVQTRRVIKPQPREEQVISEINEAPGFWLGIPVLDGMMPIEQIKCPYSVGMRLWVRETWRQCGYRPGQAQVAYRADGEYSSKHYWYDSDRKEIDEKWRPSIFMYRAFSRITLEITGVRVERVQSINEEDVFAEGLYRNEYNSFKVGDEHYHVPVFAPNAPARAFAVLWDSINLKRGFGWDSNPYVWVVQFKVFSVKEPADTT